jgi:hypothetical protein
MHTQTISSRPNRLPNVVRGAGILAALIMGTMFMQLANAGCLDYQPPKKAVSWQTPDSFFGSMRLLKVSDEEWGQPSFHAPIVGLWAFKYISKGNAGTLGIPDGAIIDGGNTLWYADGNENTVSGVRDPETGNVCLGVWKRTGEWTYELNHIGLSWDPTTHAPAGPAFIKQHVTLAKDGNSYSGTFTINQLGPDGKTPALPALIKGTIEATRVTINTDTQESLP